jgi:hypothetical protein
MRVVLNGMFIVAELITIIIKITREAMKINAEEGLENLLEEGFSLLFICIQKILLIQKIDRTGQKW